MPDREKVILALKIHAEGCGYRTDFCTAQGCPYAEKDYNCDIEQMCRDSIELLKEQEAEILDFIGAIAKLTAENETLKMIYGNPGQIVGELIRCKDCKFWYKDECSHLCKITGDLHPANWFCADGERK